MPTRPATPPSTSPARPMPAARPRPLRQLALARGWGILCLCAPALGLANSVVSGPAYHLADSRTGTAGTAGIDAVGGGSCRSGPSPGTAGGAGPAIDLSNDLSLVSLDFTGTLVGLSSAGGAGGKGGSGDSSGQCGKGDFDGRAGGAGGSVQAFVRHGANPVGAVYRVSSTALVAVSHGGAGGAGGNNTRSGSGYKGGDGGAGGAGGNVRLENELSLQVSGGLSAMGLVAQSGGGVGGAGGSAVGSSSAGSGKPGGAGGDVVLRNTGQIGTDGGNAMSAQSIGGFGGDGGVNTRSHSGSGGTGGDGGTLAVDNTGNLVVGLAGRAACSDSLTSGCNPAGGFGLAAQSVGGGGGHAGASAGLHILGAEGGDAGHAGAVVVTNIGAISVLGPSGTGLFAQAIGGGGGSGGMAIATGRKTTAVGGAGGAGGDGGAVTVLNYNSLCTGSACGSDGRPVADNGTAGGAIALVAQSIGGGGGVGGFAKASGRGTSIFGNASATAVGGSGGSGGAGRQVVVNHVGHLMTAEISSPALLAQSVGGGGGSAGGAVAYAVAVVGDSSAVAHGGSGGGGGNGANVLVNCSSYSAVAAGFSPCAGSDLVSGPQLGWRVATAGLGSPGLVAQSIGGGGGHGGYAMSLSGSLIGSQSFGFGGSGGTGGTGGAVFASSNGQSISTGGAQSPGLLAQSIGGGGGSGGSTIDLSLAYTGSSVSVGVGGKGASGQAAGDVTVHNPGGVVSTAGEGSQGLVAQSIGGGGGHGGSAITLAASGRYSGALAVGGSGASGGTGGKVTLVNDDSGANAAYGSGAITTLGAGASALVAQSIGGGGGHGGYSVALSGAEFVAGSASLGGEGGSGNSASAVTVSNRGALTTQGGGAPVLLAQSIGGGGGSGGHAIAGSVAGMAGIAIGKGGAGGTGSVGGSVQVDNVGAITASSTDNGHAPGILAQSIGGGGGHGGFSAAGALSLQVGVTLAVGGGGGNAGSAGTVSVDHSAELLTRGAFSPGIQAQSVGGNGGNGGHTLAAALAGGLSLAANVGGGAGKGGTGGDVWLHVHGSGHRLATEGDQSPGVLGQSLGGAGGTGGWAVSGSASMAAAPSVSLGGAGGAGGKAGAVHLTARQPVQTAGQLSPGLVGQSLGGHGGSGGFTAAGSATTVVAMATSVGGVGGTGGQGGAVSLRADAPVLTTGAQSVGILLQSVGGNGGHGGSAVSGSASTGNPAMAVSVGAAGAAGATGGTGQNAGTVNLVGRGTVATQGAGSIGVLAQSIGGGGGSGGSTAAFAASASGGDANSTSLAAAVTVGGKGAAGGAGAEAAVRLLGAVQTGVPTGGGLPAQGDRAIGVLVQSIGGSGGHGGAAYSNAISGTASVAVAIGGGGGSGGNAGNVLLNFDPRTYMATNPDVITVYGNDPARGLQHYIVSGFLEGRSVASFNAAQYLANHADLQATFDGDLAAATNHYVATGYAEGRSVAAPAGRFPVNLGLAGGPAVFIDPLTYIASHGDLVNAFGNDPINGLRHYRIAGYLEGRLTASFNAAQYLANNADLAAAYGNNTQAATAHWLNSGWRAGLSATAPAGNTPVSPVVLPSVTTFGQQAPALVAQSIGGGGGHGGTSSANATSNRHAASVSVGGYGAGGGDGGLVVVAPSGAISTTGAQSPGVLAQSIGGGGGHGGSASASADGSPGAVEAAGVAAYTGLVGSTVGKATVAVAQKFTQNDGAPTSGAAKGNNGVGASLSIGGAGGAGGKGNTVTVDSSAVVTTLGDLSSGLVAQSVGGGGGHGGSSTSNAQGGNSAVAVSLGGSGSTGGDAGAVQLRNTGRISTMGTQSQGLFAQSVGGGGGDGGSASSSSAAGGKAAASFGLGGSGGGGGSGGSVMLINTGAVYTARGHAAGLFAQSVGGGGGHGGAASSAATAPGSADDGKTSASTGSASSAPNNQGNAASAGSTSGSGASKGGAAGADSGYAASLAIGGAGGKAGHGGDVVVQTSGDVATAQFAPADGLHAELGAPAVFAQSVGGGGGSGGSSSSNADGAKSSAALSLGGMGSGGGNGGAVSVHASAGSLATRGLLSPAIVAQSVGGGGGSGGSASSTTGQGSSASVALGLGGSAGGGGKGGSVVVCGLRNANGSCGTGLAGTLATTGVLSHGVFAQSVGGGGGNGGSASSAATAGDASGSDDNSASAGGGSSSAKANSGVAVAAALGGSGGSGGAGGDVRLAVGGTVGTQGAQAVALLAQSVGGGGGAAGSSSSNASSGAHAVSLALGASGGSGGVGGKVTVDLGSTAVLGTAGALAHGVLAQSVGGGGGLAGSTSSTSADAGNSAVSLALGGKAGSGQDGGAVTVASGAQVATTGVGADALLVQSIGGGGGTGGSASGSASAGKAAATLSLGGIGGGSGKGGDVLVTLSGGSLSTQGEGARGLLAQSVGGGGGSGGSSSTTTGSGTAKSASLSLGGQSGSSGGGDGGSVTVSSTGTLNLGTQGHFGTAVLAQSVGGGGGSGGSSTTSSNGDAGSYTLTLNLGGAGGSGGKGGSVSVDLRQSASRIGTQGLAAFGVVAQSIGGGGGLGGAASWVNGGSAGSVSGGGQLGGSGGDGGAGGSVALFSAQTVQTQGGLAVGLLAQSVGGGGGVGAAATANNESTNIQGTVTLGASGGRGGAGGGVGLSLGGQVATAGVLAHAAVAQSIGGGGGLNLTRSHNAVLGGNQAQSGGLVQLGSSATVQTSGSGAVGLVAQSIGGGGGLSNAMVSATLGGAGGSANGGNVRVCNLLDASSRCSGDAWLTGSIATTGPLGHGLLAQSIGGGGGAVLSPNNGLQETLRNSGSIGGELSVWTAQAISTQGNGAAGLVAQSIGAGGGLVSDHYWATAAVGHTLTASSSINQSTGGAVVVDASRGNQAWSTAGMNAPMLVAQSIGGGGGLFAHTNLTQVGTLNLSFQLGGTGGSSDSASTSVALGTRSIGTTGAGSLGVLAQSVAGGGGLFSWVAPTVAAPGSTASTTATLNGQLGQTASGSRAFDVSVSGSPVLSTQGLHAAGVVAQSVANGGGLVLAAGRAGQVFGGTLNLGATSGDWKFSGATRVQLDGGSLVTQGDMAPALVAQTVSGGGGLGLVLAGNLKLGGLPGSPAYPGEDRRANPAVSVTNQAAITTTGAGSIGIVAQSVGNGGGLGYASGTVTMGAGGSGGHGGKVLVNSNAPISTSGINAYGILAQSVGGGGGAAIGVGSNLTVTQRKGTADAGDVTVYVNADITTTGAGAHGVVAQSVRGGGGIVASGSTTTAYGGDKGTSGIVRIVVASGVNVRASGAGAVALWGWSSTDPIVEVGAGASVLGGSGAPAMHFEGPLNELHNQGHVGSGDGHAGQAVLTVGGDITIHNRGTMLGNLQLSPGARNEVHNHAGAQLLHGGTLDLGGTGTLRNEGTLAHGGAPGAATRIDGHFEQGTGGTLALRVDPQRGVTDTLHVTGQATLAGALQPLLHNAHTVAPGTRELGTLLSAGGGLDASALQVPDTAILDFRLQHGDGAVGFSVHADFSPEGMSEDVQRLGDLLGGAQAADRENFRALTARLVTMATPQELHQAYWELSGAGATTVATVGTRLATLFGRLLTDRVGAQPAARAAGQTGHSAWAQALGERHSVRQDGAGTADAEARLEGLASGTETRLSARSTVGLALAGNRSELGMSHGYRARGRGLQLGAYGAHEGAGRWAGAYAAGSLNIARQVLDTERLFELTGAAYRARLHTDAVGARGEVGLRMGLPGWGVAPYAALQLQHFVMRAHRESGTEQPHLALAYGRSAFTQARTELGTALHGRHTLRDGSVLSLRGRLAWAHEAWTEHRMNASFQTLGAEGFAVKGLTPASDLAVLAAQAELRLAAALAAEISAQGEAGRGTRTRSWALAVRYSW